MNFTRKKIRGQNQKTRRTWKSDEGYRIILRKAAYGVELPSRYQPSVRIVLPDGRQMWDFCGRRLCKTMKAAEEVCEHHYKLWTKAINASGIRALQEIFGRIPFGMPIWVRSKLNRKVYGLLTDTSTGRKCDLNIQEPSDKSPTAETRATAPTVGLASNAAAKDVSTTTDNTSVAQPAEASAKERRKPSRKRIGKRSTSNSSKRGKKRSENSPRKNAKPSET